MPATAPIVETEEFGKFLTDLFALKVQSTDAATDTGSIRATTEYVDSEGVLRGLIACDLACAARLGAALTQIPLGAVEDSLDAGALSDNLAENLAEVLNIAVNLFPECHSQRLVATTTTQGEEASTVFAEKTAGAAVCSFDIDIQRYGKGVVTIARLES